jgi:hypothetical protein
LLPLAGTPASPRQPALRSARLPRAAPARSLSRAPSDCELCRSGPKPFYFWLFTDKLVYATPLTSGGGDASYRLNREIPLDASRFQRADVGSANAEKALQVGRIVATRASPIRGRAARRGAVAQRAPEAPRGFDISALAGRASKRFRCREGP